MYNIIRIEKENFNKLQILNIQRQERMEKGNECILTAKEKRFFEQYM